MPQNLTIPKPLGVTINSKEITSLLIDDQRGEIHTEYNEIDSNGDVVGEKILSITDVRYIAVLTDIESKATAAGLTGTTIRDIIKKALYDEIALQTGEAGTLI